MNQTGIRALIVEDDRSWQQILREILADVGLSVDLADSLDVAVAHLRAISHRLAVVDLSLGSGDYDNQDGLAVLDAIHLLDPGCVAIMLTGFATVELAVSALNDYGAFTCLRKEAFNRVEFRETVNRALACATVSGTAAHSAGSPLPGSSPTDDERRAHGLVLIVEDDAGWRGILAELLADAGCQVRLCSGYGEALGCLRREKYALAVVDLSLIPSTLQREGVESEEEEEESDGYRLLACTRAGGIPAVVVSGTASPADIERAYTEYGVFACLSKQTFDRRIFLQTIQEAHSAVLSGSKLDILTGREREVLELLAQGLTNKEIAGALTITANTVKRHLKAIFEKLDVHTRSAAAARAIEAGRPAG